MKCTLFAAFILTFGLSLASCPLPVLPDRDSDVNRRDESTELDQASAVVFTPVAGEFNSNISVSMSSATSGSTIYYTVNLSGNAPADPVPDSSGTQVYTSPVSVTGDGTTARFKAIALANGYRPSVIAEATYTIDFSSAASPTFSPAEGTLSSDSSITVSTNTTGATIYYTIDRDGGEPADPVPGESEAFDDGNPIEITGHGTTATIKAIAVADGFNNSTVSRAVYTIEYPIAEAPTFDPVEGTFTGDIEVSMLSATSGSTIYYTVNLAGNAPADPDPDSSGTQVYTSPVSVTGDGTTARFKAIAVAEGYRPSVIAEATYTIEYEDEPEPDPDPGNGDDNGNDDPIDPGDENDNGDD